MSNFEDPHVRVPTSLVDANGFAPAISIYFTSAGDLGTDFDIAVNNTGIILTQGAEQVSVSYVDRSIAQIQSDVVAAGLPFTAHPLNEMLSINSGELSLNTGDVTPDGGWVVRTERHVVQYKEETRIRLLPPYPDSRDLPWYPRINIGQFSSDHFGVKHVFGVPEYRKQVWSRRYGYPYMDVLGEEPELISERKLKVARHPILWSGRNMTIRIQDQPAPASIIEDVDENNGFLYLNTSIQDTNGVSVDYTYKEEGYIYKDVNMNPSVDHNPYVVGHFVLFYVIPEKSQPTGISRSRTVHHKISQTLLGAIYSLPRGDHPVTLLGALQVRQTNSVDDLSINDARARGGGVKDDRWEDALSANKLVHSVADLGRMDGLPYPGSSVLVYKLPESLKDTLSVEEIRQRASKHLAMGVTPIVEFE